MYRVAFLATLTVFFCFISNAAFAQDPEGAAVFKEACATCHTAAPADNRTPSEAALRALAPDLDLDAVRAHLDATSHIVAGEPDAGPIAELAPPERFRWVTSPASTMIQPSDVHGGVTASPERTLGELFQRLVR